jgi:hypothetical protein
MLIKKLSKYIFYLFFYCSCIFKKNIKTKKIFNLLNEKKNQIDEKLFIAEILKDINYQVNSGWYFEFKTLNFSKDPLILIFFIENNIYDFDIETINNMANNIEKGLSDSKKYKLVFRNILENNKVEYKKQKYKVEKIARELGANYILLIKINLIKERNINNFVSFKFFLKMIDLKNENIVWMKKKLFHFTYQNI